jgi:hypothetical protein
LLKWIEAFLKNRRQRVVMGEIVSSWKEIFSGVSQGSVIGPVLFIIYINDLPENFVNTSKMYADDAKVLSRVDCEANVNLLQNDLDKAVNWSNKWLLKFNFEKCLIMHFGKNNPKRTYFVQNIPLSLSKVLV